MRTGAAGASVCTRSGRHPCRRGGSWEGRGHTQALRALQSCSRGWCRRGRWEQGVPSGQWTGAAMRCGRHTAMFIDVLMSKPRSGKRDRMHCPPRGSSAGTSCTTVSRKLKFLGKCETSRIWELSGVIFSWFTTGRTLTFIVSMDSHFKMPNFQFNQSPL